MSHVGELDRVRRHLRAHPEVHDQDRYACGTAACIAGWAVALNLGVTAGEPVWRPLWVHIPYDANFSTAVYEEARAILGLTQPEARAVFIQAGTNDVALALLDALIDRDKGELDDAGRRLLEEYGLPTEPAGDTS